MLKIFGNGTDTVSWVAEPTKRGTFGILSSCIVTTLLCVWSAVHLNIPEKEDEKRPWFAKHQLRRKIKWLFLALLAPELVAYGAWRQRREAKGLLEDLKNVKRKEEALAAKGNVVPPPIAEWHSWNMVHAFYVVMGGFVLEDTEIGPNTLSENFTRMILTPFELSEMIQLRPFLLPKISENEISDKSKASRVTKAIVCAQASWFIAQCITRIAQSLPISLLELNTLGHSICALVIYFFWWHKPLDIEQPTLVNSDGSREIFAYFWMCSNNPDYIKGQEKYDGSDESYLRLTDDEYERLNRVTRLSDLTLVSMAPEVQHHKNGDEPMPGNDLQPSNPYPWEGFTLRPGQEFCSTGLQLVAGRLENSSTMNISKNKAERWRLGSSLLKERGWRIMKHDESPLDGDNKFRPWATEKLPGRNSKPCSRVENWDLPWDELTKDMPLDMVVSLAFATIFYGALHTLAWDAHFPTSRQKLLWRISSLAVMAFMMLFMLRNKIESIIFDRQHNHTALFIYLFTVIPFILAHLMARSYLVAECFIALSHAPAGIYRMPEWTSYIPHVT